MYILANKQNGTLYVGITSKLIKRIYEHKHGLVESFTKKYNIHSLVHYEIAYDTCEAIKREKIIKSWNRKWKIALIERSNPSWNDLYETLL